MTSLLDEHPAWIAAATAFSLVLFAGTLVAVPLFLARIPPDHFTRPTLPPHGLRVRRPYLTLAIRLLRNAIGGLLVLTGIAMLVLPGQGLLTVLMGLTLVDFPGRRRALLAALREPPIRRTIDRIRARAGRPPLQLDPP